VYLIIDKSRSFKCLFVSEASSYFKYQTLFTGWGSKNYAHS